MNERRVHQVFVASVIIKGLDALVECAGGLVLFFVSTHQVVRWVNLLTQEELVEDPRDLVANKLVSIAHHLSVGTEKFYAFYLLIHGIIKIFLVVGLLREMLWAFPASLVALTAFIGYQLYRYSYTGSVGLIALTVFDIFVLLLVWHEWRFLRKHVRAKEQGRR